MELRNWLTFDAERPWGSELGEAEDRAPDAERAQNLGDGIGRGEASCVIVNARTTIAVDQP